MHNKITLERATFDDGESTKQSLYDDKIVKHYLLRKETQTVEELFKVEITYNKANKITQKSNNNGRCRSPQNVGAHCSWLSQKGGQDHPPTPTSYSKQALWTLFNDQPNWLVLKVK